MLPAFGLTALIGAMLRGLSGVTGFLAFIGSGISDPLRYGWHILLLLATIGLLLTAGAIPQLRTLSFYGLALLGTLCAAFCLFAATRQGTPETINALLVLSPSLAGIVTSLWFAAKYQQ